MRVDLVAPPIRYPRTPLLALLLVAVIPVAALVPLLVWSDAKADEYEASQAAEDAVTGVTTTVPAGGQVGAAAPLTTGLFDFRRAPEAVAAVANANALAEQVDQVYGYVGPRSCSSVSVDGRHVTGTNEQTPVIPASIQKLRNLWSTRRRSDVADLPRAPMDPRTVGRVFTSRKGGSTGRRCSSPSPCPPTERSRRRVHRGNPGRTTIGGPRWTRCISRGCWTGSGRTSAAAPATRCSTSPPSNPNAGSRSTCTPRSGERSPGPSPAGGRPRTYVQIWWPTFDQPVYIDRVPVWTGTRLHRPGHRGDPHHLAAGPRRR